MADKRPRLLVPGSLRLPDGSAPSVAPIDYIIAWLRRRMPEFGHRGGELADRVLIIHAKTGAGKSTVLPVAVFRLLRGERTPPRQRYHGPSVICTQPRVLTAVWLANDVSASPWNQDMVMGLTVGYQTGPLTNTPPAGLVFATAGVLAVQLQRLSDAEIMGRYRFIIVDEAHERALDCDIGLAQLRDFFIRNAGNERLPYLIVMSATFDPIAYANYFGLGPANVMGVEGSTYPITTRWPAAGTNNYPAAAAATAAAIHAANPDDDPMRADILIFMPGQAESGAVATALAAANPEDAPYLVLTINREVVISQAGDYLLLSAAIADLPWVRGRAPRRRVIVSTVVAETGLTIPTLKYVIDAGWTRTTEVYPPWGAKGLITRPATKSRIAQRMGRVGRLFAGEFHPIYTENVFNALDDQQLPDVFVTGLGERYIALVAWQQTQKLLRGELPEFRVEDMTLLDPPPPEVFLAANATATSLGFISSRAELPGGGRGYGLTTLGWLASKFNWTSMEGVRVILAGYTWDVAATDLITAIVLFGTQLSDIYGRKGSEGLPPGGRALRMSVPDFLVGGSDKDVFTRAKLLIADDFAEMVIIFDKFADILDTAEGDITAVADWCVQAGLNFETLLALAEKRDVCFEESIAAGLNPFRLMDRRLAALPGEDFVLGLKRFKRCLYDGLRERVLKYDPDQSTYLTIQGLRVKVPALLAETDYRPERVLTDAIVLKQAQPRPEDMAPPMLYATYSGLVSVLDGYVDTDDDFVGPRIFRKEP